MRRPAAAKAAPGGKNGSLGGEPLELEKLPPQEWSGGEDGGKLGVEDGQIKPTQTRSGWW